MYYLEQLQNFNNIMANYRIIDDFSIGDTYKLIRNIDSVPDNQVITDAFLTVKSDLSAADQNAEVAIHIIEADLTTSDVGEVTNYEDGSVQIRFIVKPAVSLMMDRLSTYFYDIHVNLSSGEKYVLEFGKLFTGSSVTQLH